MFKLAKKSLTVVALASLMGGCTVIDTSAVEDEYTVEVVHKKHSQKVHVSKTNDRIIPGSEYYSNSNAYWGWQPPTNVYSPRYTHKLLSDYTRQFAMKLVENMKYVNEQTPIAVASFVNLDNNLKTTNVLGNQLAESLITELQEFGLSVVDYKHTGAIKVTSTGDYSHSRVGTELGVSPQFQYVLTGTLTYTDRGVIVNSRVVGTESKVVVASARGFIPHFIIESLRSRGYQDGITLSAIK